MRGGPFRAAVLLRHDFAIGALEKHEREIEEETLIRVPADLDLTPYKDEKDFALLRRLVNKEKAK